LARRDREAGGAQRTRISDVIEASRFGQAVSRATDQWVAPHLGLVRAAALPNSPHEMGREITVATYNVHRWTGLNGRSAPDPARAGFVISELDADVIALQEVLRPHEGDDPLVALSEALGLHLAFAVTRMHKRGEQGNAILSRFPISGCSVVDISHSRIEKRGALAAQFSAEEGDSLGVVATHLSVVDRTRQRQVAALLQHPQLNAGPVVLLGDMNAWRRCKATRALDDELKRHHNLDWPPSFPAARPVLALDRVYARGAEVTSVYAHDTPASRRASDHLPVVARIRMASGHSYGVDAW
jgi:endonuclease/exonuclease/phosphatase family metal-dependent hydrolase